MSAINVSLSETFSYSYNIHGSVGYDYDIEYNKSAFDVETTIAYDDPEAVEAGMCGGDSAIKTCVFRPKKRGTFTIKVIHQFRGNTEDVITYNVRVD